MSLLDDVFRLLEETPHYMSHITISRYLLERLIDVIKDSEKRIKELEEQLKKKP